MKKKITLIAISAILVLTAFGAFGGSVMAAPPDDTGSPLDRILQTVQDLGAKVEQIYEKVRDNAFALQAISEKLEVGEKLLGTGYVGTGPGIDEHPTEKVFGTIFRVTNPNDSEDITIKEVSIFNRNGEAIYEGPAVGLRPNGTRVIINTLSPHKIMRIRLSTYMWTGDGEDPDDVTAPDNWLSHDEAWARNLAVYTAEIIWEASGSASPLIGWQRVVVHEAEDYGERLYTVTATETQMVNLK